MRTKKNNKEPPSEDGSKDDFPQDEPDDSKKQVADDDDKSKPPCNEPNDSKEQPDEGDNKDKQVNHKPSNSKKRPSKRSSKGKRSKTGWRADELYPKGTYMPFEDELKALEDGTKSFSLVLAIQHLKGLEVMPFGMLGEDVSDLSEWHSQLCTWLEELLEYQRNDPTMNESEAGDAQDIFDLLGK